MFFDNKEPYNKTRKVAVAKVSWGIQHSCWQLKNGKTEGKGRKWKQNRPSLVSP